MLHQSRISEFPKITVNRQCEISCSYVFMQTSITYRTMYYLIYENTEFNILHIMDRQLLYHNVIKLWTIFSYILTVTGMYIDPHRHGTVNDQMLWSTNNRLSFNKLKFRSDVYFTGGSEDYFITNFSLLFTDVSYRYDKNCCFNIRHM